MTSIDNVRYPSELLPGTTIVWFKPTSMAFIVSLSETSCEVMYIHVNRSVITFTIDPRYRWPALSSAALIMRPARRAITQ